MSTTIREAYSKYLDWRKPVQVKSSRRVVWTFGAKFLLWCEKKDLTLNTMTPDHAMAFIEHAQLELRWEPSTVSDRVNRFRGFFRWCINRGLCKANPFSLDYLPRLKKSKSKREAFTPDQFVRMLTFLERIAGSVSWWWADAVFIAWHTGMRSSDVAALTWQQVRLSESTIVVRPIKNGRLHRPLEIPITTPLYERLCAIRNRHPMSVEVLPGMAKQQKDMHLQFRRFCNELHLPNHTFHSLRHGFVSRLANAGVNPTVIGSITGQSTQTVIGYTHVTAQAKRDALEKAEAVA